MVSLGRHDGIDVQMEMASSDVHWVSEHGLSGGLKSGWPWCLIQLIIRWSQSRRLDNEAGLSNFPPLLFTFD